jgi:hypothetical protein
MTWSRPKAAGRSRLRCAIAIALLAMAPSMALAKGKKPPPPPAAPPETDDKPPIIKHAHVTKAPIGEAITIHAKMEDESEIFAPSVYARAEGKTEYESFGMKHIGDGWEATIPPALTKTNVEYFIEAFDDQGNGPAREGTPEKPIKIVVFDPAKAPKDESKKPTPVLDVVEKPNEPVVSNTQVTTTPRGEPDDGGIATKWWFWTIIGVAVTGGVAAAIVLSQGSHKVDTVDVMFKGPDPARNL